MDSSVVMSAYLAHESEMEKKIVLMHQLKKNVVSNASFHNNSKLLNYVIFLLQILMPSITTTVHVSMAGLEVL